MSDPVMRWDVPLHPDLWWEEDPVNGYWVKYDDHAAALTEAQATIARLEAALLPFAEAAEECDEYGWDDQNQAPVDAGQCRAARAALSPGKGG